MVEVTYGVFYFMSWYWDTSLETKRGVLVHIMNTAYNLAPEAVQCTELRLMMS